MSSPARPFHWSHSSNPGSPESFHNGCFHVTVLIISGVVYAQEKSWAWGHILRKNKQCLTSVAQALFLWDLHNKWTESDWHLHLSDEAGAPKSRRNRPREREGVAASYTSIVIFALKDSCTETSYYSFAWPLFKSFKREVCSARHYSSHSFHLALLEQTDAELLKLYCFEEGTTFEFQFTVIVKKSMLNIVWIW